MRLREEVQRVIRAHGMKLNTDFGQHFLVDEAALKTIVDAGGLTREDTVLEIGAGLGILTRELLRKAGNVITIEVDARWLPLLEEFVDAPAQGKRLTIIQGNALKVPFPETPYKIVANIPYNITSRLLRHAFVHCKRPPMSLTLLVQREVADRVCGRGNVGILTVLVHLFGAPKILRIVPPGAFLPPPNVESAVLHIDCHQQPLAKGPVLDAVFRLTSLAFGKKRKMLRRSIGKIHGGMELLATAGIDPERRPETLSRDEWIALAQANAGR